MVSGFDVSLEKMLANLPARGAGEVLLDTKFAGDLEGREMGKGPVSKRLGFKRGAALENHVCAARLAPTFVRHPDDRDLANVGVLRCQKILSATKKRSKRS